MKTFRDLEVGESVLFIYQNSDTIDRCEIENEYETYLTVDHSEFGKILLPKSNTFTVIIKARNKINIEKTILAISDSRVKEFITWILT